VAKWKLFKLSSVDFNPEIDRGRGATRLKKEGVK
jgi:hypothetical protein